MDVMAPYPACPRFGRPEIGARQGQKGRMTFDGTLDEAGTTIRGKCAVQDGPSGTFTMKKQ